jgi:deoxycytidine triphosphate deaminase
MAEFGFLSDEQIRSRLQQGDLIERGTWEEESIRHASYTLRLGDRVELAKATDPDRRFMVVRLAPGEAFDLAPFDTALLYSRESLNLPENVLGFTVARGLLFTEALCPENTYVDPGFSGSLYTTVVNVSNRVVQLSSGMPISRLFFCQLSNGAQVPYRSGASQGISQQIASVPSRLASTPEACRIAPHDELLSAVSTLPLCGNHLVELFARERKTSNSRLVMAVTGALIWPVILHIGLSSQWISTNATNLTVGTVGSLVAAAIAWGAGRLYRLYSP